jgi:hypothetical protein
LGKGGAAEALAEPDEQAFIGQGGLITMIRVFLSISLRHCGVAILMTRC